MLPKLQFTLCFLTRGDDVLMLHRNRPPNAGLWNGIGGHWEEDESALQGVLREIEEETGYHLEKAFFCGILTWEGFEIPAGGLVLFTAQAPEGEPQGCSEGKLAWKPKEWLFHSPEVVSNIHVFAPYILNGSNPLHFHFIYEAGKILAYKISPVPAELRL
ncbi:NUDIX hydrolase [Anaerolinea thermophila]|uniref:NTP pyrophosphohydrolase n=1 Tax=Anaerolinea thermophila (strain DSM 14523 / JCM 11388 / NBRC 100420 / UNI-1) TaxID=926569 RepID=E8N3S9_ANATU|nr:8-oxo-dGTP diphosphatase [Anaerolinea thermophila]BAJ63093.1 putative NTP pyrophosphohydrolase [Anaerolinea thermophila UNI-1]